MRKLTLMSLLSLVCWAPVALASSNCDGSSISITNHTGYPITIKDVKTCQGLFCSSSEGRGKLKGIEKGQTIAPRDYLEGKADAVNFSQGNTSGKIRLMTQFGDVTLKYAFESGFAGFGKCKAKLEIENGNMYFVGIEIIPAINGFLIDKDNVESFMGKEPGIDICDNESIKNYGFKD